MKVKKTYFWFALASLIFALSACNDNQEQISDNATISTIYLFNDSIEGLKDIKFGVDNTTNKIYNVDSADFGLRVDSAFPIIIGSAPLLEVLINDELYYNVNDTVYLDFSKTVKIRTTASDEETTKEYTVDVIVHQVNPDTFMWVGMNSEIYADVVEQERSLMFNDELYMFTRNAYDFTCHKSKDGKTWTSSDVSDISGIVKLDKIVVGEEAMYYSDGMTLFSSTDGINWDGRMNSEFVDNLLFCLKGNVYAQVGNMPGAKLFKCPEKGEANWTEVTNLPTGFPQSGMAIMVAPAPNLNDRVFILGGRDADGNLLSSLWSSDNGSHWVNVTVGKTPFTPRENVAIAQYADGLLLYGGLDKDGLCQEYQLYSADFGLNWEPVDSIALVPDLCVNRHSASMQTDTKGYIYIVGGRAADNTLIKNVWRGLRYASIPGFLY